MALPLAGALIKASDLAGIFQTNTDAWTPYTPTWSGTIGNGAIAGRYMKIGRRVDYEIILTWGTTTTHPAAAQTFTMPVAAAQVGYAGGARITDFSAGAQFYRHAFKNTATQLALATEAGAFVTNLLPMTWATSDACTINGAYESAS